MITTRRNQRLLRTSTGDSVRNRDYWTINAITTDGDLTVTRIDGHGTITLPADYVTEHVQLGYAATEPGNQSDTATASHHPRHRRHDLSRAVRRRHPRPRPRT